MGKKYAGKRIRDLYCFKLFKINFSAINVSSN